jgi:hypothetical protein
MVSNSHPGESHSSKAPSALLPNARQQLGKLGALARNNKKWDTQRQAIHQFYIVEDHTLKDTMNHFQEAQGFKARSVTFVQSSAPRLTIVQSKEVEG